MSDIEAVTEAARALEADVEAMLGAASAVLNRPAGTPGRGADRERVAGMVLAVMASGLAVVRRVRALPPRVLGAEWEAVGAALAVTTDASGAARVAMRALQAAARLGTARDYGSYGASDN